MIQNNRSGNDERLRHWQKAGVFFFFFAKYAVGMQFYKVSDIYVVCKHLQYAKTKRT